ncbi:MAG: hypothetical protein HYR91_11070 [Flavobacteriia bacterium]|nr:hypothetical protein [Flavobacteriia bacterium]
MARELIDISNELKQNFVDHPTIQSFYSLTPGLTFDAQFSKVSLEGILFYCLSVSIWVLEKLFDDHKAWIENRATQLILGNTDWYKSIALDFQFGDALEKINDTYVYPVVNESLKIVKFASVKDQGNLVLMKVAGIDSSNLPVQLTTPQLTAFNAYIKKRKFAGVKILIVSREADLMKLYMHIYIDSLVLDSTGTLLSDGTTKPVEVAINNFIQTLPFNTDFNPNDLIDVLQTVQGVINPCFDSASAKFGLYDYVLIGDYYNPNAGYLKIDPAFPLSTTINYILS